MAKDKLSEAIGDIMNNVLDSLAKDEQLAFEEYAAEHDLRNAREAIRKLIPSDYAFAMNWPHQKISRGFLGSYFPNNNRLIFLFTHYEFVEHHFGSVYRESEGMSCYMDKTRSTLRRLARYLYDGTEINFDEGYSSPTLVLKDQQSVLDFYDAVVSLFYGKTDRFIELRTAFPKIG